MISLDALIGVAGCLVTVMVVAGMILLTPRGAVNSQAEGTGANDSTSGAALTPEEPVPQHTAA